MAAVDELLAANRSFSDGFDEGGKPMPPARGVVVVTCMDARIDPAKALGLEIGDAHVIRNAGGRVSDDAIRSLIISTTLLGTREVVVIQHTDCGMLTFKNEDLHSKLADERGTDASDIDFLPFPDLNANLREDVERIRSNPHLDPVDHRVRLRLRRRHRCADRGRRAAHHGVGIDEITDLAVSATEPPADTAARTGAVSTRQARSSARPPTSSAPSHPARVAVEVAGDDDARPHRDQRQPDRRDRGAAPTTARRPGRPPSAPEPDGLQPVADAVTAAARGVRLAAVPDRRQKALPSRLPRAASSPKPPSARPVGAPHAAPRRRAASAASQAEPAMPGQVARVARQQAEAAVSP